MTPFLQPTVSGQVLRQWMAAAYLEQTLVVRKTAENRRVLAQMSSAWLLRLLQCEKHKSRTSTATKAPPTKSPSTSSRTKASPSATSRITSK